MNTSNDKISIFDKVCSAINKCIQSSNDVKLEPATKLRNALVSNSIDFIRIFTILENEYDADLIDDTAGEEVIESIDTLVDFVHSKLQ